MATRFRGRMMQAERAMALMVFLAAVAFAVSPMIWDGFGGYPPEVFPIPQDDPPVQPADWAFSIWGLIYAWLIAGAGFGLFRRADDPAWRAMRPWLLASLAIGFFWLTAAMRSPLVATAMIAAMLALALMAFGKATRQDRVWQLRPVALYAGWLTAATGASVGMVLAGYGVMSEQAAAIVSLVAVTAVAFVSQKAHPSEWAYPAGVVWALAGIFAANLAPPNWALLLLTAAAAAVLIARFWQLRSTV